MSSSLPAPPSPSSTSAHVHQPQNNRSTVDASTSTAAAAAVGGVDPLAPLVPAIVCVVLVTVIFMSIAGNLLVCIAIATDRNLRKLSNLFLVSLAVADLFVATLVMTFALANDLIGHWIFGEGFCNVWIAFDVMGSTSSILNLCAISLDRYLHIRDPLRYSRWMTKSVVLTFIASIWLTSCLVSFLPISQGLHLPPDTANRTVTGPPSCAMDLSPTYAVVSSSISFFLPCCVMVAFYTRLYMYARMHVKNIKAMTRPIQLTYEDVEDHHPLSSSPGPSGGGSGGSRLNSHGSQTGPGPGAGSQPTHVSEHKAAVTLGIIMGTFLICWVPFFIINITAAFCKTCISELCFKILTWLGYANSALNPIIYSIFNQEFRRAFARTLSLYGHKCFCLCYYCRPETDEFCSNGKSTYHHHGQYEDRRRQHHHQHEHEQIVKTPAAAAFNDDKRLRGSNKKHAQSNGKHAIVDGQHGNSFGEKDSSM